MTSPQVQGRPRKISLSIQLSKPADHDGCELHFQVDSKPARAPGRVVP